MKLFYCDHHPIPLPAGHKFPTEKYRLLREKLAATGEFELEPAPLAEPRAIELAHDPEYVRAFLDGTVDARAMRRIGFPWSPELVIRTLASAGGTLAATREALRSGVAGNLAGGTHHACREEGSGFCVFNDIAVAARDLQSRGAARRIAVVDLDVHQGDGTALIFDGDPDVLTLSIHGAANFPFRKQRSGVDFDLRDGTGDSEYLGVLESALPRVFEFAPEIVFYQSGVDGLGSDRLGRLALTIEGLRRRDEMMLSGCRSRGIPLVITLGGGYSDPISRTVEAHANTFLTAAQYGRLPRQFPGGS